MDSVRGVENKWEADLETSKRTIVWLGNSSEAHYPSNGSNPFCQWGRGVPGVGSN